MFDPKDASLEDEMMQLFMDDGDEPLDVELESLDEEDEVFEEEDAVQTEPDPSTPEEAAGFLKRFFSDKMMHYGGPVPESELLTERNVEIVLRLELMDCVDIFHEAQIGRGVSFNKRYQLFLDLQAEAEKKGLPKAHSGGLMLVYLNLCEGYSI